MIAFVAVLQINCYFLLIQQFLNEVGELSLILDVLQGSGVEWE